MQLGEQTEQVRFQLLETDCRIGKVFTFEKGTLFKVEGIESGEATCVRAGGDAEFPKALTVATEVLEKVKPAKDDQEVKSCEKGFEFSVEAA